MHVGLRLVVGELTRILHPFGGGRDEHAGLTDAVAFLIGHFGVAVVHVTVVQDELAAAVGATTALEACPEGHSVGTARKAEAVAGVVALGVVVVGGISGCHTAHVNHTCGQVAVGLFTQDAIGENLYGMAGAVGAGRDVLRLGRTAFAETSHSARGRVEGVPAVAGLAIGGVLLKPRVGKLVDALCAGKLHEAGGQGEE